MNSPHAIGATLPLWSIGPFVGLLLSIAVLPLVAPRLWHHHYPKITLGWALLFIVPFVFAAHGASLHAIAHTLILDYVPFVLLLGTLFTISGGIVVRGTLRGTPETNVALLAIGTLLASCIGTTGACMVLIRPLLRANAPRRGRSMVVVFFIFLVGNIGGALTPLGDPPLFLGFLRGVPFFWTLHLLPHFLVASGLVLACFYLLDRRAWRGEAARTAPGLAGREPLRVAGAVNFWLLAGVIGAVLFSGMADLGTFSLAGIPVAWQNVSRDAVFVVLAWLSLRLTPASLRAENRFGWSPLREVAILFAGIFMTMIPALAILNAGEHGALGPLLSQAAGIPWRLFWVTGGLSAFLDNAPTYLTFLTAVLGRFYENQPLRESIAALIAERGILLEAIAAGAVFMGAMTYIGNAPNFMVRSIAEESGIAMPSFFGYLLRWSIPVLVPVFVVVTLLFFN